MSLQLACHSCKARKRKCDKQLPKCSLCSSKKLRCEYPTLPLSVHRRKKQANSEDSVSSSPTVVAQRTPAAPVPPASNNFPAVFYLDWHVFWSCQIERPKSDLAIPAPIPKIIGGPGQWETIASEYFSTVHAWWPIISKRRFYGHVTNHPVGQLRSDYALLILCMKMIMDMPREHDPRTAMYLAAKHSYLELEIQGVVSLQVLQAGVLIALYEFGHAIFPSAAVSVEACVRYGRDLGINWDAKFPEKNPFSWIDIEEQKRAWWSIFILDRVMKIGYPRRDFLIPCPSPEVCLPADDAAWDEGVMPPTNLGNFQSHSPQSCGRLALTAEVSKLLGQVIDHIAAEDFGSNLSHLHNEQGLLLDNALRALEFVTECESHDDGLYVMNQNAMCSIARILLHEAHASRKSALASHFNEIHLTKEITKLVARSRAAIPQGSPTFGSCMKEASPFLAMLCYQSAVANLRIYRETKTQEALEAFMEIKGGVKEFDLRWKAAGAYLKILEAREVSTLSPASSKVS